ncbi:hypothetical protein DESACE_00010 (plasmid) [Desulfurella acetivorans A63]|nr:hypothetical protein DESACE_00010 [Desulfurella acetivorans A63]
MRKKLKVFSAEREISIKDLLNEAVRCYLENHDKIDEICQKGGRSVKKT